MNRYLLKQLACCLTVFFFLIPLAKSQGSMGGMNAQINQVEAVESHLQQSRTQSSREAEDVAKKKPKAYDSGKSITSAQGAKSKKVDGDSEKNKMPAAGSARRD